jgi:hypothetical protein
MVLDIKCKVTIRSDPDTEDPAGEYSLAAMLKFPAAAKLILKR